jgi:hypothetical protein
MTLQATAQLVRNGQQLPGNQPIPVGADGTTVALTVPAGLELVDAALTITLTGDSDPIELTAGAVVTSDRGPGAPPVDKDIKWVAYEWGARRGLVTIKAVFTNATTADAVRLRLSDGGPWLLASPGPLLPLKVENNTKVAEAHLPGLSASRVMFEPVTTKADALNPEDHDSTPLKLLSASVTGARRPPTLTVSVGDAIVHHEGGLLPAGARVFVREALLASLRERAPGHAGGVAAIRLTAPAESAVQRIDLSLRTREIVTRFRGGQQVAADVEPGGVLVGQVDLGLAPTRVRVRVRADLRGEYRVPAAAPSGHAHRCTPDSALAQAFAHRHDDALVGVDLLLGPRTAALAARVTFHGDDRGTPAAAPFAAVDLGLADQDGVGVAPTPRLVALDLPEPVRPPTPIFWVALAPTAGEALWFLGEAAPDAPPLSRRERGEPWVPRDMPFGTGPKRLVALAELRLRRSAAPDPPSLRLRWQAEGPPLPTPAGRLDVSGPQLPPAPDPATKSPLEFVATCPFAGRVELAELAVDLPEQTELLTFGS